MNIEKKKTSPALFVRQVRQELQKVTWPQRRDTFISSAIVMLLIVLFSLLKLISWLFELTILFFKINEIGKMITKQIIAI